MDPSSAPPIDPRLEPALRRLRRRIRAVLAYRGSLVTGVTALAVLLVLVALDAVFSPLPVFVRWMCPALWLAAVSYAAVVAWWLPLREPLELVRVARWLETQHPELDERISTVLEVSRRDGGGMSGELIRQLAKEASGCLDHINPQMEVSSRRATRWLWPAAALLLVWAALFAIWPGSTARHVTRTLVPTSKLGNAAGRIAVEPGSAELIEGDSFQVTARHTGGAAHKLEIVLHLPDGTSSAVPMTPADGGWSYQLGRADRGFDYEVRRGRESSDRFKVKVWPRPRLADPRVRLEFPAYTGWAPREQALGDAVAAIRGTRVELKSRLNTPVGSSRLEIDGQEAGETRLDPAADGGGVASKWALEHAGHSAGRLLLGHRLGREFEAARFMIESTADLPPEVKWLAAMKGETRVRPDDLWEMGYEVADDVGLGAVAMEVQPERGEAARLTMDAPPRAGRSEPPVWRGRASLPVGELAGRWPGSRVFKLRVRAEDSRTEDFGGPGVGVSEWVVIRIDDGAESLARQEVAAAHSDARETLEEARRMVQQAREKIDRRREDLKKEEISKDANKDLTDAREQLAEARETLESLADRMEESVHAARAEEARKAAESVEQARQQLENTPLQDTPQQRDQSAASAREKAEAAERQLEKLRDDIQRDEARVRDYARLKELEQQQREVARQAAQATAQNPENETGQAWRQKQDQVAEALRQEAQQQPQAQAAALEEQAREARQLAAEAREQAAGQDALKQLAQDPAAANDALREQLAKEQAEIAGEAREQLAQARERQDNATANALPEAAESAEQAGAELARKNDRAAAAKAKEAASQLKEAATTAREQASEKSGPSDPPDSSQANAAADLADLAGRQENVSEALSALDQGKSAEAAARLSEMRARQTAGLAGDIRETPQVDGNSGPMQQAANSSEQAAGQAQQAARADSEGKPAESTNSHGQSSQQLQQTAAHLEQAAADFASQAAEAAGRKAGDHKAPVPAQPLAEAFRQASRAADVRHTAAAASHAQAAADALSQAAAGTLRAMQGRGPAKPGQGLAQQPGPDASDASIRAAEPDPGVPPELAKLGISAEDWETIKSSLRSDAGGSAAALPEEYRELVRSYFEQMSKGGSR